METQACAPTDINDLSDQLTGALVALSQTAGRSTKFVSAETDDVVYAGLQATSTSTATDSATLSDLIELTHKENTRLADQTEYDAYEDFDMTSLAEGAENIQSIKKMILAGVRGVASYAGQARKQGIESEDVNAFLRAALTTFGDEGGTLGTLIPLFTTVGEVTYTSLQMREDAAATPNEQTTAQEELVAKVAAALTNKGVSHIFVALNNDSAAETNSYFHEFASKAPADTLFVIAGTSTEAFTDLDLGEIDGIPRVITADNVYKAVEFTVALMGKTNIGVNEMPITFLVSKDDDKSMASLATLLWIGLTNVCLVPGKPAIVSDSVLNFFTQAYHTKAATGKVEADLNSFLSA